MHGTKKGLITLCCIMLINSVFAAEADTTCVKLVNDDHVLDSIKNGMSFSAVIAALGPLFNKPTYIDQRFEWKPPNSKSPDLYSFTVANNYVIAAIGDTEPTAAAANAMPENEKEFLYLLNVALDSSYDKKLPLVMALHLLSGARPAGYTYVYQFQDNFSQFIAIVVDVGGKVVNSGSNCDLPEPTPPPPPESTT